MTSAVPARGRARSLGRQLPLLISALLLLTLLAATWVAYREVKRARVESAAARLHGVVDQLADLSATSSAMRVALLRRVAADTAIRALLRAPGVRFSPSALAAAQPLIAPPDTVLALALWNARGERVEAQVGPVQAPHGEAAQSLVRAGAAGDSLWTGAFYQVGDSVFYWRVVPVREGDSVAGWLGQRQRLASAPQVERQISELVGEKVSILVTDTAGRIWTTLGGRTANASATRAVAGGLLEYTTPDGEARTAARARVAGTPWTLILSMPTAEILERPHNFLRRMALAMIVIVLAAAAGAWALSRHVTSPLRALTGAAEAIAAGDYGRRVTVGRDDEIGRLGETFNAMAARVAQSQTALQAQAESLRRSNEALALQKAAAEAARAEAEKANQTKSDFLAVMSHEIRTPINAILGYTQLLEIGISGPVTPEQRAQLERVRTSGHHLLGLVNELLDLARVEAGQLTVLRERAVAAHAADAALTLMRPQAAAKGITIVERCNGPRDALYVGDEQRVRQVVVNLLSNAVKFTNPGGSVSVRCDVRDAAPENGNGLGAGPWTTVSVEDTGIGIAPDQVVRVFEPFVQAETGLTRTTGGVGLGLAISRRLARLMGGDLTVRSRLGEGSCFTLWLPAPPEGAGRPAAPGREASATPAVVAAAALAPEPELASVGRALFGEIDAVVERLVARLRSDAQLPFAATLTDVQLQDHIPTFLADVAQSFVILRSTAGASAELLRDGSDIQQGISERHGAQRLRLGWTEAAVAREFALLREEVNAALARRSTSGSAATRDAHELVDRFIQQAERASLRGLRNAALTSDSA